MKPSATVTVYDTTLRDGTQGTGISFSVQDKLRVAERLDEFGVDYIEGGWPGSNPKDIEFFAEAAKRSWKHAKITAFGMTRRGGVKVEDDAQVRQLLEAGRGQHAVDLAVVALHRQPPLAEEVELLARLQVVDEEVLEEPAGVSTLA